MIKYCRRSVMVKEAEDAAAMKSRMANPINNDDLVTDEV
jgi:hypothetical protein